VTRISHVRRAAGEAGWRAVAAGPAVAVVTVVLALIATHEVGLPLRDPDHVAATYLVLVGFGVLLLVVLDIAIRAARRSGGFPPGAEAMRSVRRERWTLRRSLAAGSALLGFYVTYMAYRNLKGVVPLASTEACSVATTPPRCCTS
jgi:hypothetical protein